MSEEERLARYEELWAQSGFAKWFGNFGDTMSNLEANATMTGFVRNKIRGRVNDPVLAEILVPKDHPWGTRRVPLESGYYEAYNRDNVLLVDLKQAPIECITPRGIKTGDKVYEFDVIIYATGFDAVTGAFNKIDIQGAGKRLRTSGPMGRAPISACRALASPICSPLSVLITAPPSTTFRTVSSRMLSG